MSQELAADPSQEGLSPTPKNRLQATAVSRKLQEVGQYMLGKAELTQVGENVLSTCSEAIESLGDRLLRSRDTRVPLVEIATFPDDRDYDALIQLFGVRSGKLILKMLRSDGLELNNSFQGNHIEYQTVGLVIPTVHTISLGEGYGSTVESVLSGGTYSDYDDSRNNYGWGRRRPSFGSWFSYEGDRDSELSGCMGMTSVLDQSLIDFEIAIKLEGVIDVDSSDKPAVTKQLSA